MTPLTRLTRRADTKFDPVPRSQRSLSALGCAGGTITCSLPPSRPPYSLDLQLLHVDLNIMQEGEEVFFFFNGDATSIAGHRIGSSYHHQAIPRLFRRFSNDTRLFSRRCVNLHSCTHSLRDTPHKDVTTTSPTSLDLSTSPRRTTVPRSLAPNGLANISTRDSPALPRTCNNHLLVHMLSF